VLLAVCPIKSHGPLTAHSFHGPLSQQAVPLFCIWHSIRVILFIAPLIGRSLSQKRDSTATQAKLGPRGLLFYSICLAFFLNRIRTPLNQVLGAITGNQVLQAPFLLDHCIEFSICSRTFISDRTFCLVSGTFCFVF